MLARYALTSLLLLVAGALSCKGKPAPERRATSAATVSVPAPAPRPSVAPRPAPPAVSSARSERILTEPARGASKLGIKSHPPVDLAPAAPASAAEQGAVLLTEGGDMVVVPRGRLAAVAAGADFASRERPPAIAGGFAYFVHREKLVRRALGGSGPLETLASGVQHGSRVSALAEHGGEPAAAAYLTPANEEGTRLAKLWSAGKSVTLTPDGAGASSVALVRTTQEVLALSLDGRSGMTPVHARSVHLASSGPAPGKDQVVWVLGPAQWQTEIRAVSDGARTFAFVAIEKDVSHFGLIELALGEERRAAPDASWRLYENGIDAAPVAAAILCGQPHLAFARPLAAKPRSPQELVLSQLGRAETMTLARAESFRSVSLAPAAGGGLAVYVADGRTFALDLACH